MRRCPACPDMTVNQSLNPRSAPPDPFAVCVCSSELVCGDARCAYYRGYQKSSGDDAVGDGDIDIDEAGMYRLGEWKTKVRAGRVIRVYHGVDYNSTKVELWESWTPGQKEHWFRTGRKMRLLVDLSSTRAGDPGAEATSPD